MSYILDALRRADAERRRGQSPVLHDVAGLSLPPPARRPTLQRLLPWLAGGLLLTGGLLWAWRALGPGALPAAAPAPPTPVAVPAPAVVAAPPPAAPRLPPSPVVRVPPPVAAPAPAAAPKPPPTRAASAPTPAPADDRPLPASALPEPQRSAVARLAFGGAVHSADRAQSFVLLAGQIVREGETLAPGIVLERIAPRALTLRVGAQRVELPL